MSSVAITTAELEAIRREHQRQETIDPSDVIDVSCSRCYIFDEPWPCATIRLVDTLDTARDSRPVGEDAITQADAAASLVHDYIWQKPVLSGTTPPSQQQASDAVWSIHKVLRALLQAGPAAVRPADRNQGGEL